MGSDLIKEGPKERSKGPLVCLQLLFMVRARAVPAEAREETSGG